MRRHLAALIITALSSLCLGLVPWPLGGADAWQNALSQMRLGGPVTQLNRTNCVELLLRAHATRLRVREVTVRCRARQAGVSKVSGTLEGSARAAAKILATIVRHAVRGRALENAPLR